MLMDEKNRMKTYCDVKSVAEQQAKGKNNHQQLLVIKVVSTRSSHWGGMNY